MHTAKITHTHTAKHGVDGRSVYRLVLLVVLLVLRILVLWRCVLCAGTWNIRLKPTCCLSDAHGILQTSRIFCLLEHVTDTKKHTELSHRQAAEPHYSCILFTQD